MGAARSYRHADADLGGALGDAVSEGSVEARGDEDNGEQTKKLREAREEKLAWDGGFKLRALGDGLDQRQVRVQLLEGLARLNTPLTMSPSASSGSAPIRTATLPPDNCA